MHCRHSGNDVGEVRGLGLSQGCGDQMLTASRFSTTACAWVALILPVVTKDLRVSLGTSRI